MRKSYITALMALCAILMFSACGNAGAQSNKKWKPETAVKAVKNLNKEQFCLKVYDIEADEPVFLGDKPVIVDFTASWCGPCQRISPILEELAVEYADDIIIYKVNIDNNRELAKYFNVSSIPALLYIPDDGKEPVMTIGARSKDKFKDEIETLLLSEK